MELLRKITIGGINNVRKGFKGVKEKQFIARCMGIARGFDVVPHVQYGDSYKFNGEFRAVNQDGEESAAPVIYLVKPVDEMLRDQIKAAEGKPVNFAFDIFLVPDEGSERGYQYRVQPLMETAPSDPLAELMKQVTLPPPVKAKQAALPGTEAAAPAAPVETVPEQKETETVAADSAPATDKAPKGKNK